MAIPDFRSFSYSDVADKLHRLRAAVDSYTPNIGTISPLIGGPMSYALQGAAQGDILTNHKPAMLPTAAPAAPVAPTPASPSPAPNPANWGSLGYPASPPQAPTPTPPTPAPPAVSQPTPAPTPQPRPAVADAQPQPQHDMSFFQRNAAMMRDPSTGAFIDPMGAAQAVRGPDLISKMMDILHKKATG